MTTPATKYLVNATDLAQLFAPIGTATPGAATNMLFYKPNTTTPVDLNTVFLPLTASGQPTLGYSTNFKAPLNGVSTDLNAFFQAKVNIPFTVNNTSYSYTYNSSTKYFTLVFANFTGSSIGNSSVYSILTFTSDVKNLTFALIGGGGGGSKGTDGTGFNAGTPGGGGAGGSSLLFSVFSASANTVFNITVGGGGSGGGTTGTNGSNSLVSYLTTAYAAAGGNPGVQAITGQGGVGSGTAGSGGNSKTAGGSCTAIIVNGVPYNYGGGGAGGTVRSSSNIYAGGQGGGCSSSTSTAGTTIGNASQQWNGPNNITYAAGTAFASGWPGTGGGGAGGAGGNKSSTGTNGLAGFQGGSGMVIVTFQIS